MHRPTRRIRTIARRAAAFTRAALLWLALGIAIPHSIAQQPPPAPDPNNPAELKKEYQRRIAEVSDAAKAAYTAKLVELEKQRVAARDYRGAERVKAEIEKVAGAPLDPTGEVQEQIITLAAADATVRNSIAKDTKLGVLHRWKETGQAEWDIRRLEPGPYEVRVTYAATSDGDDDFDRFGGFRPRRTNSSKFLLIEHTSLSGGVENKIEGRVSDTGGWDKFRTESIGTLTFARTSATLRLEAANVAETYLMVLKKIELIPQAKLAAGGEPEKLAKLREWNRSQITAAAAPITEAYIGRLNALGSKYQTKGDLDSTLAIKAEKERAAQEQFSSPPPASSEAGAGSGLKKLEGAKFFPERRGSWDRLTLGAGGEGGDVLTARLAGIRALPVSPDGGDGTWISKAIELGLRPKDLFRAGRDGKHWLEQQLAAGDFTAHQSRDGELVQVTLANGKNLSAELVSRGFAIPSDPYAPLPTGESEDQFRKSLLDALDAAKENKQGVWGRRDG